MRYQFEEVPSCPLCGSKDKIKLSKYGRQEVRANVVFCQQCSLGFLSPRWTEDAYIKYYTEDYDQNYRGKRTDSAPTAKDFENVVAPNAQAILQRIVDHDPEFEANTILDIGAEMGKDLAYLEQNKFHGANCYAIEPSDSCMNVLRDRQVEIVSNDVNTNWHEKYQGKFDLVVLRHVLEHLLEPQVVLEKIRSVLSDQGILYLAVPDSLNPKKPVSLSFFRVVHTFYFNEFTLSSMVKGVGFDVSLIENGGNHNPREIYLLARKGEVPSSEPEIRNQELADKQISLLKTLANKERTARVLFRRWLKRNLKI